MAASTLALTAGPAGAQFSPGELSRFHQGLEGARNCRHCHEAGRGVTASLCLTCHTALAQRIAAGTGLHARGDYRACERCHVEHQGRGFDLVFWGRAGRAAFDHTQTGFALQGRHARLSCESCHGTSRIRDPAALARGGVNLGRTFLGLASSCTSCHTDPHRGQFAPRGCTDCHGQEQWKPPSGFDHDGSDFPLTGRHEQVACARCHPTAPGGGATFKGVPHQTCASCHKDPHSGRLGTDCAGCHATAGWSRVEPGRFDHGRTRFPLTGRHQRVACDRCHAREPGGGLRFQPLTPKRAGDQGTPFQGCASCHKDPHAGRLGQQCTTCHRTEGWDRLQQGGFDHDRTRFPLRGRHAGVDCDECHRPGQPRTLAHARCTDCHVDRHAGQLARRSDGGRCNACHDVSGFEPARFTPEDHARTPYPLTGAHLAVPCNACHKEVPLERLRALGFGRGEGLPAKTEQLRFATTRCAECHQDPHGGQTARLGACDTCHRTDAWSAVSFDHSRTTFPLEAGHARVRCGGCHRDAGVVTLAGRPRECAACHKDPHGAQFARNGRTDCARCHTAAGWAQFRFDHDRETSFPLVGAHRAVPCKGCHLRHTPEGRVLRYSGLGKACTDCHGAPGAAPPRGR